MRRALAPFAGNREGVAAVEFALVAPVLLTIVGGLADFGLAFRDQSQLADAVANGATYAFAQQQNNLVGGVSAANVKAAVQASIGLPGVTVTVTGPEPGCVQTNNLSNPPSASLDTNPKHAAFGQPCPDGSRVGTYIVITTQYTYQPLMPFYSKLASTSLAATVTVRLA